MIITIIFVSITVLIVLIPSIIVVWKLGYKHLIPFWYSFVFEDKDNTEG